MNKKQEIERELRQEANGSAWISKAKIQRYMGKRPGYITELVDGLERLPGTNGQAHLYHAKDVAGRIVERIEK